MKAWLVREKGVASATVVFAETRGKARALAICTDACEDADWCDVEVYRSPQLDKYYEDGKMEMDWYNPKDRIALVKDANFVCVYDYLDVEECEVCHANQYCARYQDYLTEKDGDTE